MDGANNKSMKLFGAMGPIPLSVALVGVNYQVISQMKNDCLFCASGSLLRLANVLEREEKSMSPMMPTKKPTNAEAGTERTNAIIYNFRPRCLPSQEEGIAFEAAFHQGKRPYGNH